MAQIIAGAAIPRGPTFTMLPERWPEVAERDKTHPWLTNLDGSPTTYEALLTQADPSIVQHLTRVAWQRQFAVIQQAYARVLETFHAATPDVALVMGDDENEWFQGAATPRLAVYRGATWTWGPYVRGLDRGVSSARGEGLRSTSPEQAYPVAVELVDHVVQHLQKAGYAVEVFDAPVEGKRMPHAFGLQYDRLLKTPIPLAPMMVNVHFPPTQPSIAEQYRLGQELRQAVESWGSTQRVAVVANGGLSIGVLRPDMDRRLLDALERRDMPALTALPYKWIQGPCGEIFNWIGAAGALEGLAMRIWDYVPVYRTPAGTGCGNAFATWSFGDGLASP